MSDNSDKKIGITYSLFATDDGEVMTGSGDQARDEFIDFLAEEFSRVVKGLTDENPHRIISFILDIDPTDESREGWVYHTEKYHPLAFIMIPLGRIFSRLSSWLWGKSSTGEWKKAIRPLPAWAKED